MDHAPHSAPAAGDPLATFTRCHSGILQRLQETAGLPQWLEAAARARQAAQGTVDLFRQAILPHHREEEAELFPAVLQSARPDEKARVEALVWRLTAEHTEIEALWKKLEPAVRDAARGHPAQVNAGALGALVDLYVAHARREEAEFLPLAAAILGRNGDHLAALGLALHMRHQPVPPAYI